MRCIVASLAPRAQAVQAAPAGVQGTATAAPAAVPGADVLGGAVDDAGVVRQGDRAVQLQGQAAAVAQALLDQLHQPGQALGQDGHALGLVVGLHCARWGWSRLSRLALLPGECELLGQALQLSRRSGLQRTVQHAAPGSCEPCRCGSSGRNCATVHASTVPGSCRPAAVVDEPGVLPALCRQSWQPCGQLKRAAGSCGQRAWVCLRDQVGLPAAAHPDGRCCGARSEQACARSSGVTLGRTVRAVEVLLVGQEAHPGREPPTSRPGVAVAGIEALPCWPRAAQHRATRPRPPQVPVEPVTLGEPIDQDLVSSVAPPGCPGLSLASPRSLLMLFC